MKRKNSAEILHWNYFSETSFFKCTEFTTTWIWFGLLGAHLKINTLSNYKCLNTAIHLNWILIPIEWKYSQNRFHWRVSVTHTLVGMHLSARFLFLLRKREEKAEAVGRKKEPVKPRGKGIRIQNIETGTLKTHFSYFKILPKKWWGYRWYARDHLILLSIWGLCFLGDIQMSTKITAKWDSPGEMGHEQALPTYKAAKCTLLAIVSVLPLWIESIS